MGGGGMKGRPCMEWGELEGRPCMEWGELKGGPCMDWGVKKGHPSSGWEEQKVDRKSRREVKTEDVREPPLVQHKIRYRTEHTCTSYSRPNT